MDSDPNTGGPSLLDVILNRLRNMKEKKFNSRVMYIGCKREIPDVGRVSLCTKFHEKLFEKVKGDVTDFPYGIMYESKENCLHILEGKYECLQEFLRNLHVEVKKRDCILHKVLVLHYIDDIGMIMFPRWTSQNVSEYRDEDEDFHIDFEDEEGTEWLKLIYFTEHKLLNIGKRILDKSPTEMDILLYNLVTQSHHLIPGPELMSMLAKCDKCFSLDEYASLYFQPINLTLDEELVWPAPSSYDYIKEKREEEEIKKKGEDDVLKLDLDM